MSCVAQIEILEIHQKEIFPGEISVTISGCESGFWCWTQSQVTTRVVYWWNIVFIVRMEKNPKKESNEKQRKIYRKWFYWKCLFTKVFDYLNFSYQHATAQSRRSPGWGQEQGHGGHVGLMRTINENLLAGVFLSRSPQLPPPPGPRPCRYILGSIRIEFY